MRVILFKNTRVKTDGRKCYFMGRPKLTNEEERRMKTTVTIRMDLKEQAKSLNINLSKLLEKAILKEVKNQKNKNK